MKYFFIALFLFLFPEAFAQDYIITWENDTVAVDLPGRPRKEGFRPQGRYENGYSRVAALFENDSVRVVEAGQVKGYYREKHGRQLLCNGDFVSMKVPANDRRVVGYSNKKDTAMDWYFMRRIGGGTHASLYVNYVNWGTRRYVYYYLALPGKDPQQPEFVRDRKHLLQLLDSPEFSYEKEKKNFRRSWRGWVDIVNAFNRRKS